MGLNERFNAWIEEWTESVIEAGGAESDLRDSHEKFGPTAVAAGQAMIGEWLAGLANPDCLTGSHELGSVIKA